MSISLVVLQGPSAVGKSTIQSRLGMPRVVTWTSRPPREGERDGVDYCFKERAEIQRLYGLGQMVEMTEYHGNLYGTPLSLVEEIVNQAEIRSVILDRVGAEKIRQLFGDRILLVGVKATRADCERRLEARGHGAAEIGVRLSSFEEEVEALSDCDIILNNTDANRDKVDALTACIREGLVNRA